jgi:hypothetical protein
MLKLAGHTRLEPKWAELILQSLFVFVKEAFPEAFS